MTEEKKTTFKKTIEKKVVVKTTAEKKAPAKKVVVKKTPAKKTVAKKVINKIEENKEVMHNMFKGEYFYANGKRKTAIARVRIYKDGKGEIIVNWKDIKDYFQIDTLIEMIKSPFKLAWADNKYSITAKIVWGGVNAQADALRHGIAKALVVKNEDSRTVLKKAWQLTRDARKVERKKPGLRKARRAHQWVKR